MFSNMPIGDPKDRETYLRTLQKKLEGDLDIEGSWTLIGSEFMTALNFLDEFILEESKTVESKFGKYVSARNSALVYMFVEHEFESYSNFLNWLNPRIDEVEVSYVDFIGVDPSIGQLQKRLKFYFEQESRNLLEGYSKSPRKLLEASLTFESYMATLGSTNTSINANSFNSIREDFIREQESLMAPKEEFRKLVAFIDSCINKNLDKVIVDKYDIDQIKPILELLLKLKNILIRKYGLQNAV